MEQPHRDRLVDGGDLPLRSALGEGWRRVHGVALEERLLAFGVVRMLAGQHLVDDDAEGVEVGGLVHRRHSEGGLRGHEPHGAEDHALGRERHRLGLVGVVVGSSSATARLLVELTHRHLREAEVDELDPVRGLGADHHVARIEVAVDDVEVVDRVQPFGDLARDVDGALERDRAPLHEGLEVDAVDELADEVVAPVGVLAEVGGTGDVPMRGVRADHRFALEARHQLGQAFGLRVEQLDGDVFVQVDVLTGEDGAHSPHGQDALDSIALGDDVTDESFGALLCPQRSRAPR